MPFTVHTLNKSSTRYNRDPRAVAIEELQQISRSARDEYLGANWFAEVESMYNLSDSGGSRPSFRPPVNIPQLQILMLGEAVDLSDASPKIYLANPLTGKRDEQRERAFQEQWKVSEISYQLLFSILWSQFAGIGWLQLGHDPFANKGRNGGNIWARHRHPGTVDSDPAASCIDDSTFQILNDRLYPSTIQYHFPETGRGVSAAPSSAVPGSVSPFAAAGGGAPSLRMPDGPMSAVASGLVGSKPNNLADGRLDVRYCFLLDNSIEVVDAEAGSDAAKKLKSIYRPLYPNGRFIVEVEGEVIADGSNPTPGGALPATPLYGMPPLTGFLPPPPMRFTKDLQQLSGRMLTQAFENAVRLNNGVWFLDENCEIDTDAFGGLPGEVVTIKPASRIPTVVWPTAMPEHMLKMPMALLQLQKELQGFSQSREGSPGAGNLSADLYEASIYQSKRLTRLRAKLLAKSVKRVATLLYGLMAQHYNSARAFPTVTDQFEVISWLPADEEAKDLMVHLDERSIMPISQAALRQMAPMLRQTGALDLRTFLEYLEVPDAAGIAERMDREMQLVALNKLRRR